MSHSTPPHLTNQSRREAQQRRTKSEATTMRRKKRSGKRGREKRRSEKGETERRDEREEKERRTREYARKRKERERKHQFQSRRKCGQEEPIKVQVPSKLIPRQDLSLFCFKAHLRQERRPLSRQSVHKRALYTSITQPTIPTKQNASVLYNPEDLNRLGVPSKCLPTEPFSPLLATRVTPQGDLGVLAC